MRKIFANLKSVLAAIVMVSMLSTAALSTSCSSEYDDTDIKNQLKDLTERVEALEGDFEALQTILTSAVLEAEQDADGNWVITTEDGTVNITVAGIDEGASAGAISIIEVDGVLYWAYDGEDIAPVVDEPYIRENPATGEAEISFDGKNWYSMGGYLISNVAVKDNSLVLTIGGYEVVVPMAEEVVFDIRAGFVTFASEETIEINVKTQGIEDLAVLSAPKGWYAEITAAGTLSVTAPNEEDTKDLYEYNEETWEDVLVKAADAAVEGYVKVHANTADGKCLVGKLKVKIGSGVKVVAYGGKAFFSAPVSYGYANYMIYGAAKRDEYVAQVEAAFAAMDEAGYGDPEFPEGVYSNQEGWDYIANVEKTFAELLGYEPEVGVEYVAWAYDLSDYYAERSLDQTVLAIYTPVSVKVTEDETKRTAYNIDITIEVKGTDKYIALVSPDTYVEGDPAYYQEQMANYYAQYAKPYGVLYEETYTGAIDGVTANTSYSMTGNMAPDLTWYVFVLPIDERPVTAYTPDAVQYFTFKTSNLTSGGSVNVELKQVTEYMGEVFSYDIWDYVETLITLDPYTELGVEVTPSSDDWLYIYSGWFSEEAMATMLTDEKKVEALLKGYGFPKEEADLILVENGLNANQTMTLVCFFVDKDGKYGNVGTLTLKTDAIAYSDATYTYETNLDAYGIDGYRLKNTTDLEITPSGEASKYRVLKFTTNYYNPYEGLTAEQLAEKIVLAGPDEGAYTYYEATDLVDGKIVISGHDYGSNYIVAVVAYDAEGKPCKTASVYNYLCTFAVDNVSTEGEKFTATEPKVELLEMADASADGFDYAKAKSYYEYSWVEYYSKYRYNFDIYYTVEAAENTKVYALLFNDEYKTITSAMTAADKVSGLLTGEFSAYYTEEVTPTEETPDLETHRYFGWYQNEGYSVYLMVAWEDAEGNYYYKEYNVSEFMAPAIEAMDKATGNVAALEVGGKQWLLPASLAANEMIVGAEARSVLDLGVTAEGSLLYGISYEDIYGSDAAGIWMNYGSMGAYTVEATDATSGVIKMTTYNHFEEEIITEIPYQNLTETTCEFNLENLLFVEGYQTATLSEEVIPVQAGGVMM